jgi:Glycosyltransferase family 87
MPSSQLGRYRIALVAIVIVMTMLKLLVAANTFGTSDVGRWMDFAAGVAEAGPVGVYRLHFDSLYNHPPLIGYMLEVINAATRHGLAFPLAIRIPAISADAVTPFIVLELLRKRRTLLESFAAAASVAVSPVLFVISGFHGNTDPVFIMFSLLSVYLLVERRAPALAGISIAIALGVKIVPIVIVPTLLAFTVLAGWRYVLRFGLASGALLAATWVPVVLRVWQPFRDHVLGYTGGRWQWGLVQLVKWAGNPAWVIWLRGPGRFLVGLVVAGLPAALVLWRPRRVVEASALALTGLLVLSPAGATQYLVWAVAPAYLLSFWGGTAYNLIAGCLLIEVYTRWSGRFPWYYARGSFFTGGEVIAAFAVWGALLMVVVAGIRRSVRSGQPPRSEDAPSCEADPTPALTLA